MPAKRSIRLGVRRMAAPGGVAGAELAPLPFERMPMAVAILDREYRLLRFSQTWAEAAAEYTPSAADRIVPGACWFDVAPGTEEVMLPLFQRVLAGDTVREEALRVQSGGIVSFWDVVLSPLIDDGQVIGIVDVTADATARVQALDALQRTVEALAEREERLSLVMQGTNDGVWDWDLRTGRVVYSPRWHEMLGYREGEVEPTLDAWQRLVHPDDLAPAMATIRQHLDGRASLFQLEHRLLHRDGTYCWILTRGTAVRDAQGRAYRMVGSHTDVTAHRQAEEELRYRIALDSIVVAISTEFINLPPEHTESGIQRALQTIGEFTEVDRSYLFLLSPDGATFTCTLEWCAPGISPQIEHLQQVPVAKLAWSNRILMRGEVLHIPRVTDLPPEAESERVEFTSQGIRSLVAVPMLQRGQLIGFLGFDAVRAGKEWSEESIGLLRILGEIVVNALERRRVLAIEAGQRQLLELLATGGTLPDTLNTLVRLIEEQWPGMLGLVLLLDNDGRRLHVGAGPSLPADYLLSLEGLEIGPLVGSCGTASYTRQRVIVEDIATDPRWDGLRDLAVRYGLGACWSEPVLSSDGRVIATFAMYYRHRRAPSAGELQTIKVAAHLVGVTVEHKQAQEALQRAHDQLEERVRERTTQLTESNARLRQEVTQRLRAQEALRASEAKYRQLVENATSIILQIDTQGQITFINRYAQEYFGYSEEEILGKNILNTIVPRSASNGADLEQKMADVLAHPAAYHSSENENVRRNGERVWVAWTNRAVYDAQGRLSEILCIGIDRTAQRRADDEMRRAVEAAEAANQAKSAFLANVSHELRTPLNAILGFAQLMARDGALAPEQQNNLEIIRRSGEHLLALINDVLDVSKIEAGRVVIQEHAFDLTHLLDGLEEMFALRAQNKGLTLLRECDPGVPRYIRGDEGKLRQVLMNLLSNAVKFTVEGGVVLRVRATLEAGAADAPEPDPHVRLHCEVADTGPGIAPDEVSRIFEQFVQARAGQQAQEGTGLGLRISQQFVRLMGGELTVDSVLGEGSVFRFEVSVPVACAADVEQPAVGPRVIGLAPGQPAYRVLVVEDREANRILLVRLLAPLGFEVREATNGQEAVEVWQDWRPHLIWMDMRMPVMSGYEATQRIKATTEGQATVIIALTASAFEEDRAVILSQGCDDFVRKPFREQEIYAKLTEHLGVRFVHDEAPGAPARTAADDSHTLAGLASAPEAWRDAVREATRAADLDRILALAETVRPRDAALADGLAGWARDYDYERILVALGATGADAGRGTRKGEPTA